MLFVDSHPDGLVLTDVDEARRFGPSRGLTRMMAIAGVLLVSATSAGLLAFLE